MKKLFVFLLAFISVSASAQIYQAQNGYGFQYKRLKIDSTLHIPTFCGVPTLRNSVIGNQSAIAFDSCNNILYKYDPKYETWSPIGTGSYIQDGLISGGIVTWSGSGLKFYVTPAVYVIGGKFYNSPFDSVTLATAPTSDSRIDLIGVDTTGHAFATTGTASATPLVPQADITSQIALTTGILLNAGDTVPSNVTTDIVYSEGIKPPDWDTLTQGTPMVVNFTNTTNPYGGSKDVYVSKYSQGSTLKFVSPSIYPVTTDATLSFWVYLNGKFTNQIYAQLYDASTSASAWLRITSYININDSAKYQLVTVPVSSFAWTKYSGNFDRVLFNLTGYDTSGTKGFYLDNIQFQKGINSIPPQTDYSNKLDSVLLSGDTLWQYSKGVKTFKGLTSGSGTGNTKYVHEGWGIKIDSSGNNYTVAVDSTLLKDSLYAGRGIKVDTTTYPNHRLIVVDSNYVRDTSLHLGGGTINQVLKKNSSTNGDWSWQDESGGSGGTDSAAVHVGHITVVGDTSIVFSDLKGNSDTVTISLLQYWLRSVSTIYTKDYKVAIGQDSATAEAKLTINGNEPDSATNERQGIVLKNGGSGNYSPPITFYNYSAWNGGLDTAKIRISAATPNGGASHSTPTIRFESSVNGSDYAQNLNLQVGNLTGTNLNGTTLNISGFVNGGNASIASTTTTQFLTVTGVKNVIGGGVFDTASVLTFNPTNLGILPPRLTKIQRDSINLQVVSIAITNGGTGYTSAPFTATTSYKRVYPVTFIATVSGGAVTSVSVSKGGSFNGIAQVNFTGGGGTGATAVATMQQVLPDGLELYCTDCTATDGSIGVKQTWQSSTSTWKNAW